MRNNLSNYEVILYAVSKGAELIMSVSGGKDGQAMTKAVHNAGLPIHSLIHMDLGVVEWKQSKAMCQTLADEIGRPLHILRRNDGKGLLEHARTRMEKLQGTGKPFWYSSSARYCTSDTKRLPANNFFRNCGENFIISCEGIRAEESTARSKKVPLEIRWEVTSAYYKGMTVEQAIANYNPAKRLALTWFPIFHYTLEEVWETYDMSSSHLELARTEFKATGQVPSWWAFHPAYAMGNSRVSCVICPLQDVHDMMNGIRHNPQVAKLMSQMEIESGFTIKTNFSITKALEQIAEENS